MSSKAELSDSDNMNRWLMETKFINHQDPKIKELSARISSGLSDDKSKAIAAHDWVRDNIPFGWSKSFWHDSATDVLEAKVGFCDTKSTLLIALLRSMGIPARHYIVNIHRDILKGIVTPTNGISGPFVHPSLPEWTVDQYR